MSKWEARVLFAILCLAQGFVIGKVEKIQAQVTSVQRHVDALPHMHETNYFVDDDCVIRAGWSDLYFERGDGVSK